MNLINRNIIFWGLAAGTLLFTSLHAGADGRTKALPCTACHGADGNSTLNPEWPNLAGQHVKYMVAQLQAFKTGVRKNPNMNGMAASLSDDDMVEISEFFSAQALKVPSTAEPSATGAALYRGGNKTSGIPACMACHGPNGVGIPHAGYPSLRGQHAKYTILQLEAYRARERTTDPKEIMRAIASRMTRDEIEGTAAFIQSLR